MFCDGSFFILMPLKSYDDDDVLCMLILGNTSVLGSSSNHLMSLYFDIMACIPSRRALPWRHAKGWDATTRDGLKCGG